MLQYQYEVMNIEVKYCFLLIFLIFSFCEFQILEPLYLTENFP